MLVDIQTLDSCGKYAQKDYCNKQMVCEAPVLWSKCETIIRTCMSGIKCWKCHKSQDCHTGNVAGLHDKDKQEVEEGRSGGSLEEAGT